MVIASSKIPELNEVSTGQLKENDHSIVSDLKYNLLMNGLSNALVLTVEMLQGCCMQPCFNSYLASEGSKQKVCGGSLMEREKKKTHWDTLRMYSKERGH
uniref:Uncharacterized protein n=1 Tax=Nelumbo nucifera TaxID=4432 RepID=A0A822YKR4_NELNU|nr:TPA_asm: hypothetical protein HUJ06_011544 [Nelumbo nucifera]